MANGKTSHRRGAKPRRSSSICNLGASLLHDIRRVILSNGWLAGAGDFRKKSKETG